LEALALMAAASFFDLLNVLEIAMVEKQKR
jgi:hypothetical protein